MQCPTCQNESRRFGRDRYGNQRYQCQVCRKTFSDRPERPLDEMRLPLDKALFCLQLLTEGNSIRATVRISGVAKDTVIALLVCVGEKCEAFLRESLRSVPASDVQAEPLIASGRLAAAAVVAFAGRPSVLRAIEGLPLPQQIALANGQPVRVIDPGNADAVQEMPLERLPSAALRLVFGEGELRTPEAQRLALRPRRRSGREETARRWQPIYDPQSGTVRIGRMTVRVSDIVSALASAAGPDRPPVSDRPDDYLTLKTRLTREEHDRFLALCKRHELPDWEMIRKALRAFGLI